MAEKKAIEQHQPEQRRHEPHDCRGDGRILEEQELNPDNADGDDKREETRPASVRIEVG